MREYSAENIKYSPSLTWSVQAKSWLGSLFHTLGSFPHSHISVRCLMVLWGLTYAVNRDWPSSCCHCRQMEVTCGRLILSLSECVHMWQSASEYVTHNALPSTEILSLTDNCRTPAYYSDSSFPFCYIHCFWSNNRVQNGCKNQEISEIQINCQWNEPLK